MIEINFGLFVTLCVFAVAGVLSFLFLICIFVIEPFVSLCANYKKYKKFYIENISKEYKNGEHYE